MIKKNDAFFSGYKNVGHRRWTIRAVLVTATNIQRTPKYFPVDQSVNIIIFIKSYLV